MIPLRDENRSGSFPIVNVLLIAACTVVFLYEVTLPTDGLKAFFDQFALTPGRISYQLDSGSGSWAERIAPFFTSMFLHGGWLHLIGNMWYLWIFGDNIEDRLGHLTYLVFYLLCGFGAGIVHTILNYDVTVPSIGASGATAGVLGA
ncbi:MAG TPA: rhomboid family intramembrane serine protease, partial [Candidatus Binatia bacterium]|nr:rhomboid family intramembrane serine protease [Candidatus Binatia bacterium]